jgi:hypothetical protein
MAILLCHATKRLADPAGLAIPDGQNLTMLLLIIGAGAASLCGAGAAARADLLSWSDLRLLTCCLAHLAGWCQANCASEERDCLLSVIFTSTRSNALMAHLLKCGASR